MGKNELGVAKRDSRPNSRPGSRGSMRYSTKQLFAKRQPSGVTTTSNPMTATVENQGYMTNGTNGIVNIQLNSNDRSDISPVLASPAVIE